MILPAIGGAIIALIFAAAFAATVSQEGWRVAALTWAVAFAITGLFVLAVFLIVGGPK